MFILYVLAHMIDGVPGLPRTAWRLLDAGELRFMDECVLSSPLVFSFYDALPIIVAAESIIQNSLDVLVVFVLLTTPRVEIYGSRVFRLQNDEGVVLVTAQNSSWFKEIIILRLV